MNLGLCFILYHLLPCFIFKSFPWVRLTAVFKSAETVFAESVGLKALLLDQLLLSALDWNCVLGA